jgi:glycosyltransferase involved in cell wall biosynthesis
MKVLIVSPYFPYPTNFGGAFDIYYKILELHKNNYEITLVVTVNSSVESEYIAKLESIVSKLIIISRIRNIFSFFQLLPYQVSSRKGLKKINFDENFEFAIIESEYVGIILKNKKINKIPYILRLHNNESKYYWELFKSEKKILTSLYYALESLLFYFYSKKIIRHALKVCCVSSSEAEKISSLFPTKNIKFTPAILDIGQIKSYHNAEKRNVLYVGSLFTPNNIESIHWYINNVHEFLKDIDGYHFIVIGSTKNANNKKWLLDLEKNDKNLSVYFDVDNLDNYYMHASVFVNPVLNGAGVKIKNLNSISKGLPLVTTTKGNDGSGFIDKEDVLIADTPQEFRNCVRKLLENQDLRKKLSGNAQKRLQILYDPSNIIKDFML